MKKEIIGDENNNIKSEQININMKKMMMLMLI